MCVCTCFVAAGDLGGLGSSRRKHSYIRTQSTQRANELSYGHTYEPQTINGYSVGVSLFRTDYRKSCIYGYILAAKEIASSLSLFLTHEEATE